MHAHETQIHPRCRSVGSNSGAFAHYPLCPGGIHADSQVQAFVTAFEAALNDPSAGSATVDALFTADMVDHAPWPGHSPDVAGFTAGLAEMRRSFPDLNVAVERTVSQGDLLTVHSRMSGTQLGDFMGAPASGKTFNIEAIDIMRLSDGRIAEHWGVMDAASLAGQLGP